MAVPPIESSQVFKDADGKLTPQGQADRWTTEFQAARSKLKKWHGQGEKILDRYLDERAAATVKDSRLNLFTANTDYQYAMLYGQRPKASVERRFQDPQDDVARVAGEMLERLINADVERDGSSFNSAIGYALEDRLLPGFGIATARYEVETEATEEEPGQRDVEGNEIPGTAKPAGERKVKECVETDYRYWKDVLWSPCRTFETSRWWAFCTPMTKDDLVARFDTEEALAYRNGVKVELVPMNTRTNKRGSSDAEAGDPYAKSDVWEIWSKEDKSVYWFVEGFDRLLDARPDPYGLQDFYPFPKPLMARPTTRNLVPRPDFVIAQDIYDEIDNLSTRLKLLEDCIRVTGVYDKASAEVAKVLSETGVNKLYPSENFAMHREKGGIGGSVDWFPLDQITKAIAILTEKRNEKIGLLQQVTGWSDIMRGQSSASETLGAQKLKAQYGSVRIRKFQEEFARFATDLQRIKGELIAKLYDVATIVEQSNILRTPDAKYAQQAAQLIKDKYAEWRIEVKPESVNLQDFATLKQERIETIQAIGGLVSATAPLVQAVGPAAAEFILVTAQWMLAGLPGGSGLEAEFDAFREQLKAQAAQPKPPAPPDPKLLAAKAQAEAKVQGAQIDMAGKRMDMQVKTAEHGMKMKEMQAEMVKDAVETRNDLARAAAQPPPMPGMPA